MNFNVLKPVSITENVMFHKKGVSYAKKKNYVHSFNNISLDESSDFV